MDPSPPNPLGGCQEVSSDGRLDKIARYLDSLSPCDLLYARKVLQSRNLWQGMASLQNLPTELVRQIASNLSLEAYLKCRLVSRSWSHLFGCQEVLKVVNSSHFNGLFEVNSNVQDLDQFRALFLRRARNRLARERRSLDFTNLLLWESGRRFPSLPEDRGLSSLSLDQRWRTLPYWPCMTPATPLYHSRKLFWQPTNSPDGFIENITDESDMEQPGLEHNRLRIRNVLGGTGMIVHQVSSKLLIAEETMGVGHPWRKICLWHFEEKKWQKAVLPSAIRRVYSQGETVVVWIYFGEESEPYLYEWNRPLVGLDVSPVQPSWFYHNKATRPPPSDEKCDVMAMFHPHDPEIIFLAWTWTAWYGPDLCSCIIHVMKYVGGKPDKYYSTQDLRKDNGIARNGEVDSEGRILYDFLSCRRLNDHGLHLLLLRNISRESRGAFLADDSLTYDQTSPWEGDYRGTFFNVVTETFSMHSYQLVLDQELGDQMFSRWPDKTVTWEIIDYAAWDHQLWFRFERDVEGSFCVARMVIQDFPVFCDVSPEGESPNSSALFRMPDRVRFTHSSLGLQTRPLVEGIWADERFVIVWDLQRAMIFTYKSI